MDFLYLKVDSNQCSHSGAYHFQTFLPLPCYFEETCYLDNSIQCEEYLNKCFLNNASKLQKLSAKISSHRMKIWANPAKEVNM